MTATLASPTAVLQLATFQVADLCLALEIGTIQEIIRDIQVTRVPHAAPQVLGVINLRGEVTTVIDLRRVLGIAPPAEPLPTQTLIVRSQSESIGLVVDRVGDIWELDAAAITPPPPNVRNVDGRYFRGVCQRKQEIILVLALEEALSP